MRNHGVLVAQSQTCMSLCIRWGDKRQDFAFVMCTSLDWHRICRAGNSTQRGLGIKPATFSLAVLTTALWRRQSRQTCWIRKGADVKRSSTFARE